MENGELRFVLSGDLPKNGKRRTKVPSGGLSKNGKRRTKVPSGGLPKNGKQKTKVHKFHRVVFRRTENGELRFWVSRVSSEKWKKPKFVSFGWASEEQKTQRFILGGFLKNGKRRRILMDW
ncbi:unnamed protein product [Rhizophagus irregularis]|nr:unnamed protein product [Rhizophagus irregularis]